jgi:hypothetical protein
LAAYWLSAAAAFAGSADKPLAERTLEEIKKKLATFTAAPAKKGDKEAELKAALKRLQAYRYLAGVPYEDLVLEAEYNRYADAAARICEKLGRLDHNPPNPGWPEADYKVARKGAQSSSLAGGTDNLSDSVDVWMFDSHPEPKYIGFLGHRRWCIFPGMLKTGFGRAGEFSAMYTLDFSRTKVPDFDFISWPTRGLMPVEFFGEHHAWNVSLNPKKYKALTKSVQPRIQEVDKDGNKVGQPLKLDYIKPDDEPFGLPRCVIFRPENFVPKAGKRYLVEIEGVRDNNGQPAPIRYQVHFVKTAGK